jgi:hypothetical protein
MLMMKIGCLCGATIFDGTDDLPHKAHLVPDQEWFAKYDAIDDEIIDPLAAGRLQIEQAYMKSREIISRSVRLTYQCRNCGRLYIDDRNGKLQCYVPADDQTQKDILRSRDN